MQRTHRLTVTAGVVTAVFGLLMALEGDWLTWLGGIPAYGGPGYFTLGVILVSSGRPSDGKGHNTCRRNGRHRLVWRQSLASNDLHYNKAARTLNTRGFCL